MLKRRAELVMIKDERSTLKGRAELVMLKGRAGHAEEAS